MNAKNVITSFVIAGLVTVAATVLSLLPSEGASAQPQCNTRDETIKQLSDKYREAPVALGVTNTGHLIEVLAAKDGKTWSIIVTSPQGMSCLVIAGEGWRMVKSLSNDPEA